MNSTLHMRVGENIGDIILDIAQTNIQKGNVEYGVNVYNEGFGIPRDLSIKLLKNELVMITDEDGEGVSLTDDPMTITFNSRNILDWKYIINHKIESINDILECIANTDKDFMKFYHGDIEDYSILDMMERYFNKSELGSIGKHTIAARLIGDPDCKVYDKGYSNPQGIWDSFEDKFAGYENIEDTDTSNCEKVLYLTVRYNRLIKMLHKEYMSFEKLYLFLEDNGFIDHINMIEYICENVVKKLWEFSDTDKGYYHPLCNTGLYNYKNKLQEDILNTKFGNEYAKHNIVKKNIMDGYDAGWLSPEGDFYGGNGPTSAMIHANIATEITKDWMNGEEKLNNESWIKIHGNEIYGFFKWSKDDTDDAKLFCPTPIQIKMICDYANKYYSGNIYTQPQIVKPTEPVSTYKLRQMDEFKLHELFSL